jgi:hypothetical protein
MVNLLLEKSTRAHAARSPIQRRRAWIVAERRRRARRRLQFPVDGTALNWELSGDDLSRDLLRIPRRRSAGAGFARGGFAGLALVADQVLSGGAHASMVNRAY